MSFVKEKGEREEDISLTMRMTVRPLRISPRRQLSMMKREVWTSRLFGNARGQIEVSERDRKSQREEVEARLTPRGCRREARCWRDCKPIRRERIERFQYQDRRKIQKEGRGTNGCGEGKGREFSERSERK